MLWIYLKSTDPYSWTLAVGWKNNNRKCLLRGDMLKNERQFGKAFHPASYYVMLFLLLLLNLIFVLSFRWTEET